jgi:hypothetical protein
MQFNTRMITYSGVRFQDVVASTGLVNSIGEELLSVNETIPLNRVFCGVIQEHTTTIQFNISNCRVLDNISSPIKDVHTVTVVVHLSIVNSGVDACLKVNRCSIIIQSTVNDGVVVTIKDNKPKGTAGNIHIIERVQMGIMHFHTRTIT